MEKRIHWTDIKSRTSSGKLKLDRNEPQQNTSLHEKIISNLTSVDYLCYPDIQEAYKNIAEIENISSEKILLTSGADDALRQIFSLHGYPQLLVKMMEPTYKMAEIHAINNGCVVRKVSYTINNNKFIYNENDFDISDLCGRSIIYLANPDNPTGYVHNPVFIEKLLAKHIVIIDETYMLYSELNIAEYYHKLIGHENLYIVRSFSKVLGAGFKLGYIISSNNNIEALYQHKLAYEINGFAAAALRTVAENLIAFYELPLKTLEIKRDLYYIFDKIGLSYIKTETNFILIEHLDFIEIILKKYCHFKIINIDNQKFIKLTIPSNINIVELVKKYLKESN